MAGTLDSVTSFPERPVGRGRILLADDDVALRSFPCLVPRGPTPAAKMSSARGRAGLAPLAQGADAFASTLLLAFTLESDGYEVIEAEDGARLLGYLRSAGPVVAVIADIRMPGGSGVDALNCLRRYDRSTPFVLITTFGSEELHEQAHAGGATAVLDKPFDLGDLRFLVRRLAPLEAPEKSLYPQEEMQ